MSGAQVLQHFSWARYGVFAAVYTVVVFAGRSNGLGPVLSGRTSVRFPSIARVHVLFLALLLALLWAVSALYPMFPAWMTSPRIPSRVSNSSDLDMVLIAALFVMIVAERRRIWAQAKEGDTA